MIKCSQCGRPAIVEKSGHPLCVDCNLKFEQAFQIRDNALKQQLNFLLDEAEAVSGVYGVLPRHQIQMPVIHQGPMSIHNIRVDRSVVGVINTGNVKRMEVALDSIHAHNQNAVLEQDLKEFTEAVLRETKLSVEARNEILEQLSVLAAQMAMPGESRLKGVMKAIAANIAANIAATNLIAHWDKIRHLVKF